MTLRVLQNIISDILLKRSLIEKIAGVLAVRFLGILASYLFSLYVSKKYGADEWGIFTLINTCILFSVFFGKAGLDTTMLKFTSELKTNPETPLREIYFKGTLIVVTIGVIISLFFGIFYNEISVLIFHKPELSLYLRMASFIILPAILTTINAEGLRGAGRALESAFLQNLGPYGLGILFLLFAEYILKDGTHELALIAYLCACALVFLASVYWWWPHIKNNTGEKKTTISLKQLFSISMSMFWIGAMAIVIGCIDLIIIGIFLPDSDVGIYSIAVKVSCVLCVPMLAVNSVVIPRYIEHHSKGDVVALQQIIRNASKIMFYICFPIYMTFLFFSKEIMAFFGNEFEIGRNVLLILATGQFINILFGSSDFILQVTGFEKLFRNIIICAGILNISLNFLLIPLYGINGAGVANLITLIALNLTSVIFIKKKLKVNMSYFTIHNLFLKSQKTV